MRTLIPVFKHAGFNNGLFSDVWRDMDRVIDNWAGISPALHDERRFAPATEISETESEYKISLDLPGVKKEDLQVEAAAGVLTVSGERKREPRSEREKAVWQRFERTYGSFKRSFELPSEVDTEQIDARFEDGVLEVVLPKQPSAQARKISIRS